VKRILSHHRYEQLKALAADFIEDYALCYPLDPFEIAAVLGLHVAVHAGGLPPAASFCSTDDGYTVALLSAHGPKYQIHLNGVKPLLRQRFTLMHEISHVWLGHLHKDGLVEDHQQEAEANFFASYLLAPDQLVLSWVPELTVAGIAEKFQVSREAAGLIHGRVLRMLNTGARRRDYDRRIASAGAQRVRSADASSVPEIEGSA
jgi:hypothetical protein